MTAPAVRMLLASRSSRSSISRLLSTAGGSRTSTAPAVGRAEVEEDEDALAVFSALHHCRPHDLPLLARALSATGVLLTNSVVERVLLRCRFAHSDPHLALSFYRLAELRRGFFHSPRSLDTILYILARSRLFPLCLSLLRHSHRSLLSPTSLHVLLSRVAKTCSLAQTLRTFSLCSRFFPPAPALNALIRALAQEKSPHDALRVFRLLSPRYPPDLSTFNTLLSSLTSPADARAFFRSIPFPDLFSYNSLIDCHCKAREISHALHLIREMRDKDIQPDVITYTCLIGGLGLAGRPDEARMLLVEMREHGCPPDTAAFNAAVRNFCIARRIEDALALLDEMKRDGLQLNATTFNPFFRCFYWANELEGAWSLYTRMRQVERCLPNSQTCMFLVRLFRRREKVEMAMELWDDMVHEGFGSLELVSDVLLDLLCDEGRVVDAERCFMQMIEKGHRPSNSAFKRIKILMKLAKMDDSITRLSHKMENFRNHAFWSDVTFDLHLDESTRRWHGV